MLSANAAQYRNALRYFVSTEICLASVPSLLCPVIALLWTVWSNLLPHAKVLKTNWVANNSAGEDDMECMNFVRQW